jgi:hypothetical protein
MIRLFTILLSVSFLISCSTLPLVEKQKPKKRRATVTRHHTPRPKAAPQHVKPLQSAQPVSGAAPEVIQEDLRLIQKETEEGQKELEGQIEEQRKLLY